MVAAERPQVETRTWRARLGAGVPNDAGVRPQRLDRQPKAAVKTDVIRYCGERESIPEPARRCSGEHSPASLNERAASRTRPRHEV